MSPATEGLYLYRVSKLDLAQSLQVLSSNGTGNITELQDPTLPDYWQFGMSGANQSITFQGLANISEQAFAMFTKFPAKFNVAMLSLPSSPSTPSSRARFAAS